MMKNVDNSVENVNNLGKIGIFPLNSAVYELFITFFAILIDIQIVDRFGLFIHFG